MTAVPTPPTDLVPRSPAARHRPAQERGTAWACTDQALYAIVGTQIVWLWWAFSRGWFLQADLSNLADGADARLTWSYLSNPLGGHFAPVARLNYWLFDQVAQLNYPLTVAMRVVCLAIATALLHRLLVRLVGRRPLVAAIIAVYALNPILLAGAAWLTSGSTLVVGQIFVLLLLQSHVRYERTHSLRDALVTGVLLAVAVLAFDQWVIAALIPPLLSLVHLYNGSLGARLKMFVRRWRCWLLVFGPLVGVLAAIVRLGNAVGAAPLHVSDAYRLLRDSWLKTIGPAWVGGPLRWHAGPQDFISFSLPAVWMVVLGQLGIAATVVAGVRRLGVRSLAAWIMPLVCTVTAVLLVGYGRFSTYGTLLAITPRYLFELVPIFAIGAALALAPVTDSGPPPPPLQPTGVPRWLGPAALCVILAMSLVSGARFAARSALSPVEDYVKNLEASARVYGSDVNIWDTPVPSVVISTFEPSHRVSDVLRLARVPARFDDVRSEPLVATADGHLTKSVFVTGGTVPTAPGVPCGSFIQGVGTWTFGLDRVPKRAEWFLRLELYQATPSRLTIEVLDQDGGSVLPIRGTTVDLGTLEARNLALPLVAPVAVRVRSTQPGTNLCLTRIAIGGPFPAAGSP